MHAHSCKQTYNTHLTRTHARAHMNSRRQEKPEVRQASRDAAMREVKERAKKLKAEKATKAVSALCVCEYQGDATG